MTAEKQKPAPFQQILNNLLDQIKICQSETKDLAQARSFSVDAYNSISLPVLKGLLEAIFQISILDGCDSNLKNNLGLIFYNDLQVAVSQHYFQEYERISGFQDVRLNNGDVISRKKPKLINRIKRRIPDLVSSNYSRLFLKKFPRVGTFHNGVTFTWEDLRRELSKRKIVLEKISQDGEFSFSFLSQQIDILVNWLKDVHADFQHRIGTSKACHFDVSRYLQLKLDGFKSGIYRFEKNAISLLITGSMTPAQRWAALLLQEQGIPVLLMHHGAKFNVFDEPFYALYEGALPDIKIIYGNAEEQLKLNTLADTTNLNGNPIHFYSRTDPMVLDFWKSKRDSLSALTGLKGKKVLYLASEFASVRYGPHRDVHPMIYLAWQEMLLQWIKIQSGCEAYYRLHPKRGSTRYDPSVGEEVGGDLKSAMNNADVIVIDYPTTSLAHACATDKPVLFFDLGLRRLHSVALQRIKSRCHYAKADIQEPEMGFTEMCKEFSKECRDEFSPLFSLSPHDQGEAIVVANVIQRVVLK